MKPTKDISTILKTNIRICLKQQLLAGFTMLLVTITYAQKNVTTVSHSTITGMVLPAGSKQDSRMLSKLSAKTLFEMETKKAGTSVSKVEVFFFPVTSGFTSDSLVTQLEKLGFAISPIKPDNKYAWLQQNNRYLITYFETNKAEINLYVGELTAAPTALSTSVSPTQTATTTQQTITPQTSPVQQPIVINNQTQPATSGFAFTTTNFDDGWNSTVQEDWVQVTKGNIIVLLHYPNKAADAHNFVLLDGLKNAWDVLVAPRYSNATNMQFRSSGSWESIEFGEADMMQNSTGKMVHVVLFKKNFNSGSGKYIEFITLNKTDFEKEFESFENASSNYGNGPGFVKMANMVTYNKFAVSSADLVGGTWTSDFTGMTQYVNAYTGADAGANSHASNESFVFGTGNTYKWDLGVASGFVGNIKFQSANANGKFSLPNNWQLYFSKIEGKSKTYDAYFSCIKGNRLLWLSDITYLGYKAFGKAR